MNEHLPSVAVVIPVRDGEQLLAACLHALAPQARARGATMIVVDDTSTDGSRAVAERMGAVVHRSDTPIGPYRARNIGWRFTDAELVVFLDMRSRPRLGWLEGLLAPLADPDVVIAGGDSVVVTSETAVQRLMTRWQPMLATLSIDHPFLPYVPTCNLATRRTTLEQLDGFWENMSGSDAEFCWRAQILIGGRVAYAPDGTVDWEPRSTVVETMKQFYRYSYTAPLLAYRFGCEGVEPEQESAGGVSRGLGRVGNRLRRADFAAVQRFLLRQMIRVAQLVGTRRGHGAVAKNPPKRLFDPGDPRVLALHRLRASTARSALFRAPDERI